MNGIPVIHFNCFLQAISFCQCSGLPFHTIRHKRFLKITIKNIGMSLFSALFLAYMCALLAL